MTSKLVLGLAVGTSAAVGTAAVTGQGLTTPEVTAAFAAAGAIGFLNLRQNRPQAQPHVLSPLPEIQAEAVIAAPRARSMAAHPAGKGLTPLQVVPSGGQADAA
jgi:hypothetical protein